MRECPEERNQKSCFARNRKAFMAETFGALWHGGQIGGTLISDRGFIKGPVSKVVDQFANDYQAANPKKRTSGGKVD